MSNPGVQTYDPSHFEPLHAVEQGHAWFRARRELIGQLAADAVSHLPAGYRVLDLGCGTGTVLQELVAVCRGGRVVGMDLLEQGLDFARASARCPLVGADVRHPPFGRDFHLLGLFDVLEHLPDDESVLKSAGALLQPGGTLLLTVPADPSLWSYYDEAAHHVRRYTLQELRDKLGAAGFEVTYITYFMQPLVRMMRIYRRLAPWIKRSGSIKSDHAVIPVVNDIFYRLLKREHASIHARRRLKAGTSLLAIARWPSA